MFEPYSVIIPAWNASDFIVDAVSSVILQELPPAQLIVVDDGSTDDTSDKVMAHFPSVQIVKQANGGPGSACNVGLSHAQFDIIAFLDADDVWLPRKMSVQLDAINGAGPEAVCFGQIRQFHTEKGDDGHGKVRDGLIRSTIVTTRAAVDRVGSMLEPETKIGEMIEWLARFREHGIPFVGVNDVVALRRIRAGSLTARTKREVGQDYIRLARQHMLRKKGLTDDSAE
ncbi:MAG: glycosyltransferase [Pseudomonadota bacterium]